MSNVSIMSGQKWLRLSVLVGLLAALTAWIYVAPPGLMGKLDAIGYAVCHRLDSHSLHIGDRQMPLCARCTGEFNAAAIALAFQSVVSPRRSQLPRRGILGVLALFFLAFALDGSNSYLALMRSMQPGILGWIPTLYATDSVTRVFTGSGMGLALGSILFPMYNQSVWREPAAEPALSWRKFAVLCGIVLAVDLGILSESPWVLYPVSILSAAGVLALLGIVFSIVWIMSMRQDNAFTKGQQLWLPAAAGLTLALLMIIGIDLVRLNLTHTWGGFPGLQ
ncbi:MAG TPA: DUF2085 domain-containing protein [Anaerolineales bacterium]|nr:DUF2085 domain-containing protein [Anaerolineales bacterium]